MKYKLLLIFGIAFLVLLCGCPEPNNGNGNGPQCPSVLQQCGSGCIPQNAICCDDGAINRYCLQPTTGCGEGTCNSCPEGQAFCGMFCIEEGRECCFGTGCSSNGEPNITIASTPKIICTFQRTEVLWSPDMPWDGSYICRGTVTFDFHGLTFPTDKVLKLYAEESQEFSTSDDFDEYYAPANTPINQVTFTYTSVAGDYFQANKPDCPAREVNGLRLVETIPDIENPFPAQEFDITIPAECQ